MSGIRTRVFDSSAFFPFAFLFVVTFALHTGVTSQSVEGYQRERIEGDQPTTYSLPSPVGEEEAVDLRLFGSRLSDVTGLSVELSREDGSVIHRQLRPVPSRGAGLASELRWSLCGSEGVVTVRVRVHWADESDTQGRSVFCRVERKNVLIREGDSWAARPSSAEYRRLPRSPGGEQAPTVLFIHSPERTNATACLRPQCVNDSAIDTLSPDDVSCQEFTDCAVFPIGQERPLFLYIRPRDATSHQIGKQVQVQFGRNVTEFRHQEEGSQETVDGTQGAGSEEGRQDDQDQLEQERRQEQEGTLGEGKEAEGEERSTERPVQMHAKPVITLSRPKQTEQDIPQDNRTAQADEENASSGSSSWVFGPSYIPIVNLLAVAAVAGIVFGEV